MIIKRTLLFLACAWLALGLLFGCSKANQQKVASQAKAFDSAGPDVKTNWDLIVTATAANDYAPAIIGCRNLQRRTDLTDEQRAAVNDTVTALNAKMSAAAQKGDAKALKAVEDVRAGWNRR